MGRNKPAIEQAIQHLKRLQGDNLAKTGNFPIDHDATSLPSRVFRYIGTSRETALFLWGVAAGCSLIATVWWLTSAGKAEVAADHAVTVSEPVAVQRQDSLPRVVTRFEKLPPPAAGNPGAGFSEGSDTVRSASIASAPPVEKKEILPAAREKQAGEMVVDNSHWAINLVSVPHKAGAERFMEMASAKGVEADLYQVTVNGKTYWRVHVPGFSSVAEARQEAGLIKKKLGLEETWVAKR